MKANVTTKSGQIWALPSEAVIELTQPIDEKGVTTDHFTGEWHGVYRGGGYGQLIISERFLLAHGELRG